MKRFKDNFNSTYWSNYNNFKPKEAQKFFFVYVEGHDDIAFWRFILSKYESKELKFQINTPSKTSLDKGKKPALERSNEINEFLKSKRTGKYLLICVDSDYDYLLQNKTENSILINNSDFIFQTFTYSIENYKCFAPSLRNLCVTLTKNDKEIFDFESFLRLYSNIIYPLFIWSIFLHKINKSLNFTISEFCSTIKILSFDTNNLQQILLELERNVKNKLNFLKEKYPNHKNMINQTAKKLHNFGLNKDNTYLFSQGHTIFDNVVLMALKPFCRLLFSEKEIFIKTKAKNNTEKKELNQYWNKTVQLSKNNRIKIENLTVKALENNFNFTDCLLYSKILKQVEKYLKKI